MDKRDRPGLKASDETPDAGQAIEITTPMLQAGVSRLGDLLEAGVSSAYVAAEVFAAMDSARLATSKD